MHLKLSSRLPVYIAIQVTWTELLLAHLIMLTSLSTLTCCRASQRQHSSMLRTTLFLQESTEREWYWMLANRDRSLTPKRAANATAGLLTA
jgi:hypothetical protein